MGDPKKQRLAKTWIDCLLLEVLSFAKISTESRHSQTSYIQHRTSAWSHHISCVFVIKVCSALRYTLPGRTPAQARDPCLLLIVRPSAWNRWNPFHYKCATASGSQDTPLNITQLNSSKFFILNASHQPPHTHTHCGVMVSGIYERCHCRRVMFWVAFKRRHAEIYEFASVKSSYSKRWILEDRKSNLSQYT